MNIYPYQFLIICPLCLIAGFVDAVVGGGGLITLPAYLIAGLPAHYANGTNRISSAMGSTASAYKFARNGFVPWNQAILCTIAALPGGYLGSQLALMIREQYFLYFMMVVLPVTGVYVIFNKTLVTPRAPFSVPKTMALSAIVTFTVCIYDGFYGPASGIFFLLAMTGIAHMCKEQTLGIARIVFMVTNISSFVVYLQHSRMVIPLGIAGGVFGMAGNYLGARYFEHANEKVLKALILIILAIFLIKVSSETFF